MNAEEFRRIRERYGLTQQGMADVLQTTQPSVYRWENDTPIPRLVAACVRTPLILRALMKMAGISTPKGPR